MALRQTILPALLALLLAACGGTRDNRFNPDSTTDADGDVIVDVTDSDGDTIADQHEGRSDVPGGTDTDGDGTPDYLDDDSDGDGIPDMYEAGDMDPSTPPRDTDGDGMADFRDNDSDNNGIFDLVEGMADTDGDGDYDFADLDNDGDGIVDTTELSGMPSAPPDTDGDGIPDYMDVDSDNDWIHDMHDSDVDTDGDTIPDYRDLDSDEDGIPDSVEAGDEDITTPPVDTDGDYIPDFRDPDSDGDGLPDRWEHENGTDPTLVDSDGDGVSDLIEVGADTDPLDPESNPRAEGNFVFVVPYNDPADPPDPPLDPDPLVDHLVFSTDLQMADVFFTLDSSGSMSGEIANLRNSLRDTVVPGVRAVIPDVWFGVGRFEDCPPTSCANSMRMLQFITDNVTLVQNALNTMTSTCGGWEPYTQDLYALASGDVAPFAGWTGVGPTSWTCTPPGSIGWPCFRPGAVPIIVQAGDESFSEAISSCSPSRNHDQAIAAMNAINAKYVGVNSGSSGSDMNRIATGTGSVDISGSPLVFTISSSGSGLGSQVVDAVQILANQVPIEVTTFTRDDPSDTVDTVAAFIDHIEPSTVGMWPDPADPTRICEAGLAVADLYDPLTGVPDSFTGVLPGTIVCFDIYPKRNETVPATTSPQTFLCDIDVMGDGFTVLDTRQVYFLVPPIVIIDLPG